MYDINDHLGSIIEGPMAICATSKSPQEIAPDERSVYFKK